MIYSIPEGVQLTRLANRPVLTTPQGGKVALDTTLTELWEKADGRSMIEILEVFQAESSDPVTVRSGLACLCEAGLLERSLPPSPPAAEEAPAHGPPVAAIIIGYNSRQWLEKCIPSLQSQTYSPLEAIVIDNGSQDDTTAWLRANYPEIKTTRIDPPKSLAHAINLGISLATPADYLLIMNPDVRLEENAIAQMVVIAQSDPRCAAVAAKLRLWWTPAFLNGIGNRVGAFSWGSDNGLGHLDLGQFDDWRELPSACFAAALVSAAALKEVGLLDEGFPMYYEDSEWCYRARLLGYRVLAAPMAVAYHAFTSQEPGNNLKGLPAWKLRNVVYGRLRFAFKLAGEKLPRFLLNYATEDLLRLLRSTLMFDWQAVRACSGGWAQAIRQFPELRHEAQNLEKRRRLPTQRLFALQSEMPPTFGWNGLPELTWDLVVSHYLPLMLSGKTRGIPELEEARRPRLLIISNDVIDEKMAGPGIRYLEMGRALFASQLEVSLAVPSETRLRSPGIRLLTYQAERPQSLQALVEQCDIVLIACHLVPKYPFLHTSHARLVIDLYDPTLLENLHYYLDEPMKVQQALNNSELSATSLGLRLGDFFICGNERQRDFWLGFLAANQRINPLTFRNDPGLRSLIDVVGVGIPDRDPQARRRVTRGVHPCIPEDSRIVLWGGGLWNWLDPLTLIRAWPRVLEKHPGARLVFLGTRHPNPLVPPHAMADKTEALAAEIGEKDRTIIFLDWVSYDDFQALLCEADVGISLHPVHVETRYSIRTRLLSYIWARLPVIVTEGDVTSEWVEQFQIGAVVPAFDDEAVAEGLNRLLDTAKSDWEKAFDPLLERYPWSKVVEPLRRYCLEGAYAPDRQERAIPLQPVARSSSAWARAYFILRRDGPKALAHRAWRYLQWRMSRP